MPFINDAIAKRGCRLEPPSGTLLVIALKKSQHLGNLRPNLKAEVTIGIRLRGSLRILD